MVKSTLSFRKTGELLDLLELILSATASILVLFVLTKIMGYRQISQMSFFDYVIGITIGSIAAEMATNLELQLWKPILAMMIYGSVSIILSFITMKSIKARRIFIGVPVVLIQRGVILPCNLKKVHYDINDLLTDARSAGFFNIGDIQYAIMENTGKVSFLPNSTKRPVTPEDLNFHPVQEHILANVIMDGKIMETHLKKIGKDTQWVKNELKLQNLSAEEVFLAVVDDQNKLTAFKKNTNKKGSDVWM